MESPNNTIIDKSNGVTNKAALKEKIHAINNYLRNNGAGYGMATLKVFNIIYGLKKIEEKKLLDKVNLNSDCKFSYLLQLANEDKCELLAELIFGSVLTSISNSKISELLFYEIPKNIKGSVFVYLIKEIETIAKIEETCNVLLSGKIYEYFIGRDDSAISELGAFFTDRHIVNYILEKLDPEINKDGSIPTMIDMFGGSGGFTTGYINYLIAKYPKINWATEINNIYHFDMNIDVVKSAGLEFFCLTGELPNMKNNMKCGNSFTDEFREKKYKYPLTNPPYGGDKSVKSEGQAKRDKIRDYIKNELLTNTDENLLIRRQKQLSDLVEKDKKEKTEKNKTKVSISMCSSRIQKFAKDNDLKGNDKESCSLMLLMDIVDIGGTAIGVLKEGIFFNKKYKKLRKCLIENFNVKEVISVPQDQFENTSTKTSIVIFKNGHEKTSEVIFSDLIIKRYKKNTFDEINGNIIITENEGDIDGVSDLVVSVATKEEIIKNDICSLNSKDYNKKEIIVGKDYELITLGDICTCLPKSKRKASFRLETGEYNFYTSSDKVNKCNVADYNEVALIIGSGGRANIKRDDKFSCSADNIILKTIHNKYLFHWFKGNMNFLIDGFTGSVLKHLSKNYLLKLKIPMPKSASKTQEWVTKISTPYDEKKTKQLQIIKLKCSIQNKIIDIVENEECDELVLGSLCKIWCGNNLPKKKAIEGEYKVYGGGKSSYTHNEYNLEGFNILISRVGSNSITLIDEKIYLTENGFSLIVNDMEMKKYFGYYLINNKDKIFNAGNGSAQKVISKSKLSKIKIKMPKNRQLIKDLEPIFKQLETLQSDIKTADELYKNLIQELSQEAIPHNTQCVNKIVEEVKKEIGLMKNVKIHEAKTNTKVGTKTIKKKRRKIIIKQ